MDEKEKSSDVVGNICTILGGALLLYPLIDQATKTIIPEMKKLTSGEATKGMKLLPAEKEKQKRPEEEDDYDEEEQKTKDDEISELKRKLAELEGKAGADKDDDWQ